MIVRIKTYREIRKTLDKAGYTGTCEFRKEMKDFCGKSIKIDVTPHFTTGSHFTEACDWWFMPQWFDESQYMIEEFNNTLLYNLKDEGVLK